MQIDIVYFYIGSIRIRSTDYFLSIQINVYKWVTDLGLEGGFRFYSKVLHHLFKSTSHRYSLNIWIVHAAQGKALHVHLQEAASYQEQLWGSSSWSILPFPFPSTRLFYTISLHKFYTQPPHAVRHLRSCLQKLGRGTSSLCFFLCLF